jgi:hypothetical protein
MADVSVGHGPVSVAADYWSVTPKTVKSRIKKFSTWGLDRPERVPNKISLNRFLETRTPFWSKLFLYFG